MTTGNLSEKLAQKNQKQSVFARTQDGVDISVGITDRFVRANEIYRGKADDPKKDYILPISRSFFYQLIKDNVLPKPVRMSGRVSVWRLSEILDAVESLGRSDRKKVAYVDGQ